jgi:hypothetical protein
MRMLTDEPMAKTGIIEDVSAARTPLPMPNRNLQNIENCIFSALLHHQSQRTFFIS